MSTDIQQKKSNHEYLIIGAGPSGLQLAYLLQKSGRDYLILEAKDRAGAFFERFPRHGTLISINKIYSGYSEPSRKLRFDWNSLVCDDDDFRFTNYSREYFPPASAMLRYLNDYASRHALNIAYETTVEKVRRIDDGFAVRDTEGNHYQCRYLIVATGLSKPHIPDIEGIEHAEHYWDFSVDADDFIDQRILILGKANSAFETANHLENTARTIHLCSPNPVQLAWESHYVGHLRAVNNRFLDTYQLKSQNAVLDAEVQRIVREDDEYVVTVRFTHASDQTLDLAFDRILLATGFRFDPTIFDENCRPQLMIGGRFPSQTPSWRSSNIPGLYFSGILMHARDYRKTMSGFIHGFRHNVEAQAKIFEHEHQGRPLHEREIAASEMVTTLLNRVSTSAELFLQPGTLCDVWIAKEDGASMQMYQGLPFDYVTSGKLIAADNCWVVTMEYGRFDARALATERHMDTQKADPYLHPVIRWYRGGELSETFHLPDNLENDWGPLAQFQVQRSLGYGDAATERDFYRNQLESFLGLSVKAC